MHRCRQYELGGPVLAKYSKGKQVNKLDLEENGGKISVEDLEKWLDANGLVSRPFGIVRLSVKDFAE